MNLEIMMPSKKSMTWVIIVRFKNRFIWQTKSGVGPKKYLKEKIYYNKFQLLQTLGKNLHCKSYLKNVLICHVEFFFIKSSSNILKPCKKQNGFCNSRNMCHKRFSLRLRIWIKLFPIFPSELEFGLIIF